MKKFTITFILVLFLFYLVGAFISGTFNCSLWNIVLKGVLSFSSIFLGIVAGIINTVRVEE